ncbi:hypothetical protein N1851_009235 [Merluccius polli]|uniref:Endonuclease/exonuclease/phosphatase domain-containing protein n=1 Tax=Merluccius polli TaxID=89951 RepID=A0AA47P468_MERPO|nr:hypothetical protein N1851_009235 [Merluccius polli]
MEQDAPFDSSTSVVTLMAYCRAYSTMSPGAENTLTEVRLMTFFSRHSCWMACMICWANYVYNHQELINYGLQLNGITTQDFHRANNIPTDIARPPSSPWIVVGSVKQRRRRRERKQKRGCRAGLLARLRKQPNKPPLTSIFLANARSFVNKMDEMDLQLAKNFMRDCSVMVITETWLHSAIPDTAVQLTGCTIHRQDRSKDSRKTMGEGLCLYVHNAWCSGSRITHSHCSPDIEVLSVMCRPFYLPRELTVVIVTAVYIPPDASVSSALAHLHCILNKQLQAHPDGIHIIAGDFNQACLRTVLPEFTQYVKCATRGQNTLDHDFQTILAYKPLRKRTRPDIKTFKTWPEGAIEQLQDCFEQTDWDIFAQPDLDVYTQTVLFYITACVDTFSKPKTFDKQGSTDFS